MTRTYAPPTAATRRRRAGIILFVIAAITTVPTVAVMILSETLVPAVIPFEAILLPALAVYAMMFTWWAQAILIVIGFILVINAPNRTGPVIFGAVVALSWLIAMYLLVLEGTIFRIGNILGT